MIRCKQIELLAVGFEVCVLTKNDIPDFQEAMSTEVTKKDGKACNTKRWRERDYSHESIVSTPYNIIKVEKQVHFLED